MPTYEYECGSCQFRFERKQRFDEEPVAMCPKCGNKSRRVIHSVPIIFKGSGFYITDSRKSVPELGKGKEESPGGGKGKGKKK
jgi:putative FmdB family regulatory protein